MGSFAAAVSDFVRQSEARVDAVVKQSAQDVFELAQTPRGKGGRIPVDTGFLRNTGSVAINAVPSGPSRPEDGDPGEWDVGNIELTIAGAQPGDTIIFGWSAVYARVQEEKNGFAQAAAMEWESIVTRNARALETRLTR